MGKTVVKPQVKPCEDGHTDPHRSSPSSHAESALWYVGECESQREPVAARWLHALGFATFLPVEIRRHTAHFNRRRRFGRRNRRRWYTRHPLFPGYLFVSLPDGGGWPDVKRVPGLFGFLGDADGVARPVRPGQVEALLAQHRERDGIELPRTLEVGQVREIPSPLFPGRSGRIVAISDDRAYPCVTMGLDTESGYVEISIAEAAFAE